MNQSSSSGTGRSPGGSSVTGTRAPASAGGGNPARAARGMTLDGSTSALRPPAHPAIKWLAIGGWGTFVAEWLMMMLVLTNLVGSDGHRDTEAAPPAPRATVTPPVTPPATTTRSATPPRTAVTPPPAAVTPSANVTPFTDPRANVMGLNVDPGHTVVLLDAIERSAPWFDDAKAALVAGLSKPGPGGATFSFAVVNDNNGRALIPRPLAYGPAAAGPLRDNLTPLQIKGTKGFWNGFDAANALKPDQIVFITARATSWPAVIPSFESRLRVDGKRVRLNVIQVGPAVPELKAFVTGANGGRYEQFAPAQLDTWRKAAGG